MNPHDPVALSRSAFSPVGVESAAAPECGGKPQAGAYVHWFLHNVLPEVANGLAWGSSTIEALLKLCNVDLTDVWYTSSDLEAKKMEFIVLFCLKFYTKRYVQSFHSPGFDQQVCLKNLCQFCSLLTMSVQDMMDWLNKHANKKLIQQVDFVAEGLGSTIRLHQQRNEGALPDKISLKDLGRCLIHMRTHKHKHKHKQTHTNTHTSTSTLQTLALVAAGITQRVAQQTQ